MKVEETLRNVQNARHQLKLARRRLAIHAMQAKVEKIKNYVTRLEARVLRGQRTNYDSVDRLLSSVVAKMDNAPHPPAGAELDIVLDLQDVDETTHQNVYIEATENLDEAVDFHQRYIAYKYVEASVDKEEILHQHDLPNLDAIMTTSVDLSSLVQAAKLSETDAVLGAQLEQLLDETLPYIGDIHVYDDR